MQSITRETVRLELHSYMITMNCRDTIRAWGRVEFTTQFKMTEIVTSDY